MKNNLMNISIFWFILAAVALYFAVTKVDKFFKIKAVDDCARISRYEAKESNGSTVVFPVEDVYQNCLKTKGY